MRYNKSNKKNVLTSIFVCICAVAVFAGVASYGVHSAKESNQNEALQKIAGNSQQNLTDGPMTEEVIVSHTPKTDFESQASAKAEKETPAKEQSKDVNPSVEKEAAPSPAPQPAPAPVPAPAPAPSSAPHADTVQEDTQPTGIFSEDAVFTMPVDGSIVMDYSIDRVIYDATLDQYRTNDSVSISAEEGTKVKAAADGTVKSVYNDLRKGNTVVIDHNNGWVTTYSQLQNEAAVVAGQTVKTGQTVGIVAAPTKYGVSLGNHIDFMVTRDGKSVDPKVVMASLSS